VPATEGKPERHIKVVASSLEHPKLVVRTRTSYVYSQDKTGSPSQAGSSDKAAR